MYTSALETQSSTASTQANTYFDVSGKGTSFQKAAFSLSRQVKGMVCHDGKHLKPGLTYQAFPGFQQTLARTAQINVQSDAARAQSLTALSRKLGGRSPNSNLGKVSQNLVDRMNWQNATRQSQKIGTRLIGMQFQLAGLDVTYSGIGPVPEPVATIDEQGCFEHIGNRPFQAFRKAGLNGRPCVLAKRVEFLKACQAKAQQSLQTQIDQFGDAGELQTGEDIVHRARLALIAAPTAYLREHYELACQMVLEISKLDARASEAVSRCVVPTTSAVRTHLYKDPSFRHACLRLRDLLIQFGNPASSTS